MVRPKQASFTVASKVIAVRLTPPEHQMLLDMVDQANQVMASNGLSPMVTPASFMLSCFLRTAAMEKQPEAPLMVHGPKKQPKGSKEDVPIPTRYEWIMRQFEPPQPAKKAKRKKQRLKSSQGEPGPLP